MTYRLDVVPRRQTSIYSCWWAATQMLFEYHTNRLPTVPHAVDPAFLEPMRPHGGLARPMLGLRPLPGTPAGRIPPGCTLADRARGDSRLRQILEACMTQPGNFIEPHHWYHRGVPVNVPHLMLWAYLTGLTPARPGLDSVQRDGWMARVDPELVERMLRSSGPIVVIRRRPEGHHAILVTGLIWDRTLPDEFQMVDIVDPAIGPTTISLRRLYQWVTPELRDKNVLVKAGRRRSPPREVQP